MTTDGAEVLSKTVTQDEAAILDAWNAALREGTSLQSGRIREAELQTQVKAVFGQLRDALASGGLDADAAGFASLRETLADISRSQAIQGFTPTDTANFVLSLKERSSRP